MGGGKTMKKIISALLLMVFVCPAILMADDQTFNLPIHSRWVTKLKKEKAITRRPYQFTSPVIYDSEVYIGTASGYFYALKAGRGRKIWQRRLASGIYSEPVVEGEHIYVADRKGIVYSLERKTGKIEWQVEAGAEISARPVVTTDTIYFATTLKQIVAIDKEGHGKKWQTAKIGPIPQMTIKGSSAPVLYEGHIYVGYADGIFVSYKVETGDIAWVRQLSNKGARFTDIDATPVINDGVIYIPTADGKTYALRASDGDIIWTIDKGGPNDLALENGFLFVSGGGKLSSVKADTGTLVWEQKFDEPEISAPAVKDGLIVIASTKDKIYVVDAATGEIKFKRFLGKGAFGKPVLVGDTVYIMTNSSRLFALEG